MLRVCKLQQKPPRTLLSSLVSLVVVITLHYITLFLYLDSARSRSRSARAWGEWRGERRGEMWLDECDEVPEMEGEIEG